jgi:hypothetical protein
MSDEAQVGGSIVMDVTERLCVFAVVAVRFVRRTDRYRTWCDVDACEDEWASAPRQRSLVCLDCGTAEFAVSKSDLASLERVTPLRHNESFKQDEFDKPGQRQTVVTVSLRING